MRPARIESSAAGVAIVVGAPTTRGIAPADLPVASAAVIEAPRGFLGCAHTRIGYALLGSSGTAAYRGAHGRSRSSVTPNVLTCSTLTEPSASSRSAFDESFAFGLSLAILLPASGAMADAQQCIAENELATKQRAEGKLAEAKQHYLVCAAAECPAVVRNNVRVCSKNGDSFFPTLVFVLVDDKGNDVTGARAFVDDAKTAEALDGHALVLNPGNHRDCRRNADGGEHRANRGREGRGEEPQGAYPAPRETPCSRGRSLGDRVAASDREPDPAGLGAVGCCGRRAGIVGYFGLSGKHQENDLKSRCAPTCKDSEVDDMYRSYLIADVSLGVSLAAASVAGYLLFSGAGQGISVDGATEAAARHSLGKLERFGDVFGLFPVVIFTRDNDVDAKGAKPRSRDLGWFGGGSDLGCGNETR